MGQYGREHGTTGPNPISENTQPVLAPRMRFLRSEPVTEPYGLGLAYPWVP